MNAASVVTVLGAIESAGIPVWIDGGWGVDALLEKQTRKHLDLDLIVAHDHVSLLRSVLSGLGFSAAGQENPENFVVEHPSLGSVDVHAIEFDARGYGVFSLPDGRRWPLPPSAFAGRGTIASRVVMCLSAEAQVHCHGQGYEPSATDLQDMEHLQQRFGVVLPLGLCRQKDSSR